MNSKRRNFLKRTVAVLATPLIVPSHVVTQCAMAQNVPLPSDILRMGMIGTGRQCCGHNIPGFVRNRRNQVVALCEVESRWLGYAKKQVDELYEKSVSLKKPKSVDTYVDYKELLARSDIDAVVISTPDHGHMTQAVDAMRAGKHVALEKPICRTIAEGQELVKVAAETKRVFRVDSEFRSGWGAHRAAELVRNGRLGKITSVIVGVPAEHNDQCLHPQPEMPVPPGLDYERWQAPAERKPYTAFRVRGVNTYRGRPSWMRLLDYCDGIVTNWGTHLMNGALWALGLDRTWPVEIEGTGVYPGPESFWNVLLDFDIKYRYADGLEIRYKIGEPYYRVIGERGWLDVAFDKAQGFTDQELAKEFTVGLRASSQAILDEKIGDDDIRFPLRTEKEDFIDAVLTGGETLEPAIVGHCVTGTCLLGHMAVRTGEKLRWDPIKEQFIGNPEAAKYIDKPITTSR